MPPNVRAYSLAESRLQPRVVDLLPNDHETRNRRNPSEQRLHSTPRRQPQISLAHCVGGTDKPTLSANAGRSSPSDLGRSAPAAPCEMQIVRAQTIGRAAARTSEPKWA